MKRLRFRKEDLNKIKLNVFIEKNCSKLKNLLKKDKSINIIYVEEWNEFNKDVGIKDSFLKGKKFPLFIHIKSGIMTEGYQKEWEDNLIQEIKKRILSYGKGYYGKRYREVMELK